jgi:hypothetical protein
MADRIVSRQRLERQSNRGLIRANGRGAEGVVRSVLIAAGSVVASLITLVSTLVAAGADGAATAAAVTIIVAVTGALAVAGIYVWRHD